MCLHMPGLEHRRECRQIPDMDPLSGGGGQMMFFREWGLSLAWDGSREVGSLGWVWKDQEREKNLPWMGSAWSHPPAMPESIAVHLYVKKNCLN